MSKKKLNSDSDEEKKKSGSESDENNSGDDKHKHKDKKDNSQLKKKLSQAQVGQKDESSEVIARSEIVADRGNESQEDDEETREVKKEIRRGESSNYQNTEISNTESIYDSIMINNDLLALPHSNATVEVWKDYMKKLKDLRDTLRRKNERIGENIGKIREKSERLEKELKELDNNDVLFSKIASLLTEKKNEMKQSFT